MTPQEKLECPMLRCRKRFANHELMLQHLYSCNWLAFGEYWCYECGKSERFNDARCKRCLGHPSKRRKIVSMAKNFFSSLGHKSKTSTLQDLDFDLGLGSPEAPPSYDSAVAPPEIELYSNEIHEIDSCEIALPTIMEDEAKAETGSAPMSAPFMPPLPIQSLPTHSRGLGSNASLSEPLIDWMPSADTVVPVNLHDPGCNTGTERPVLQVNTIGLEEYRREQKRRSKGQVAPSTSVRSTASTNSTSSTNTTDTTFSTESFNISPITAWSGSWPRAAVLESDLISAADDLCSPGGLLRSNSFAISRKASAAKDWGPFDNEAAVSYDSNLPELPADIPMFPALSSDDTLQDPLALDQPVFTLNDSSLPTDFDLDSNLSLTDNNATMPPSMPSTLPQPTAGSFLNPRSLVGATWDALQMHVADSMNKLHQITKNHLVVQLRNMSRHSIAMGGLEALVDIIEGRPPTAPLKLLCFVHLIYCFSLVIHEQDASSRSTDLFGQAMSYSTLLPTRQDQNTYRQVVIALWKPAAMTKAEVFNLLQAKTASSGSRSSSLKGKECEPMPADQSNTDSLLFVAQYFLDQLEYATIQVMNDAEIQASDLYMQHLGDTAVQMCGDLPVGIVTDFMNHNLDLYSHNEAFAGSLNGLAQRVDSNFVSTLRRLELELMDLGKMYLPSDVYFDRYVGYIRETLDRLYFASAPGGNFRWTYYRHSIKLIETAIDGSRSRNAQLVRDNNEAPGNTGFDVDAFFKDIEQTSFSINADVPYATEKLANFSVLPDTIDPCALNPQPLPTPADTSSVLGQSTAANSPPSPTPAAASSSSVAKVKSDMHCELCGYRPEGDPRWFSGSMAKHRKLQHAKEPTIYRCPYPGCTSQYKNRPDNLRQHQIDKGHFIDGQDVGKRKNKRKRAD
ncbi:hypothetical protein F66182_434 [Fusarium sp. NRRL 66182]|nr:hypothetical protein F66182_434 [Fusarium sp. NRRL 66182]